MQPRSTTRSDDSRIDEMLGPLQWMPASGGATTAITFGFAGTASLWSSAPSDYGAGGTTEPTSGLGALSEPQREAVTMALREWSRIAELTFIEVSDDASGSGTVRFAWTSAPGDEQARSYTPGSNAKAGDVWLNTAATWDGFTPGTYGFSTLLHETGHALGLGHPFSGTPPASVAQDCYAYSLMSENAFSGRAGSWASFEPTTPMLYDVLAIQWMYGANLTHASGDTVYAFEQGNDYFQTIWDGGGNDTIMWTAASQGARIDLNAGRFSTLGNTIRYWSEDFAETWTDNNTVAIAYGVTIENAIGGDFADALVGNAVANRLQGNGGNDTLTGGAGDDRLDGGAGLDKVLHSGRSTGYTISRDGDRVVVRDGTPDRDGTDTLTTVERIDFVDTAYALDVLPTGNVDDPITKGDGGNAGKAYRLYQAAFAREPDPEGLGYWIHQVDLGAPLFDLATGFIGSDEFKEKYGDDPSNAEFTTALYVNVLGRMPDDFGYAYWNAVLSNEPMPVDPAYGELSGVHVGQTTRQQMLVDFSESAENKDSLTELIGNGFPYTAWDLG